MLNDSAGAAESLQDTFVIATATLSELHEPSQLRPWLFALARNECRRRVRPRSANRDEPDAEIQRADGDERADEVGDPADATDQPPDATMQFPVVSESADATMQFSVVGPPADTTMQFRTVSESVGPIHELTDTTMQFPIIGPLADATMQFRVVSESADATDGLADVNGYLGQAELRALVRSILADMKPREREVVELSFRHDLYDNDLALALGVSPDRAHALAARTRGRLEKSSGALRTVLAGRQACPVVGELLADWDGQLSEQTRDLVAWHTEQCQTCRNQAQGALRPTVLFGLLPLAPLPPELRAHVLSRCSSTSEDAAAYRRRVVRRAESTWTAAFSQAIKRVSWGGIRANPGAAVATTAVAAWVVAAVTVTLLTFAGPRAAHAQADRPTGFPSAHATLASAGISSKGPAASPTTTAPTSAGARPSPVVTQPSTYVPSQVQPAPPRSPSNSPSPKTSKSPSPKPSNSPSPKPSNSPSNSPSSAPSPTP